ncbi:hypothetical protein JCM17478_17810 [Thermopirellula anaerolimosa]
MGPSFWLGGPHDIEAKGRFDVRLTPVDGEKGKLKMDVRNMEMDWQWVDKIDADSVFEYDWSTNDFRQGILETTFGDLVCDKLLGASFWEILSILVDDELN